MDIMTSVGLVAGTVVIATLMLLGGDMGMFVSDHAVISFSADRSRRP
jgi:chemotaxis protein MotA